MTKIVAFSDLHGQYSRKLTNWFIDHPADILLFAGDLQLNDFDDGSFFLQWLNNFPYKYKICIFGNHDNNYDYALQETKKYKNIIFLNNESVTIDGIKIWGSPYSVQFGNWWFMDSEERLAEMYEKIPDDTDILLTHTPAFGILDKAVNNKNAGSKQLKNRIKNLHNIAYHIHGHIHEAFGSNVDGIISMNVSLLDERYRMINNPVIFEI